MKVVAEIVSADLDHVDGNNALNSRGLDQMEISTIS